TNVSADTGAAAREGNDPVGIPCNTTVHSLDGHTVYFALGIKRLYHVHRGAAVVGRIAGWLDKRLKINTDGIATGRLCLATVDDGLCTDNVAFGIEKINVYSLRLTRFETDRKIVAQG